MIINVFVCIVWFNTWSSNAVKSGYEGEKEKEKKWLFLVFSAECFCCSNH